jgi:hypothetical protein
VQISSQGSSFGLPRASALFEGQRPECPVKSAPAPGAVEDSRPAPVAGPDIPAQAAVFNAEARLAAAPGTWPPEVAARNHPAESSVRSCNRCTSDRQRFYNRSRLLRKNCGTSRTAILQTLRLQAVRKLCCRRRPVPQSVHRPVLLLCRRAGFRATARALAHALMAKRFLRAQIGEKVTNRYWRKVLRQSACGAIGEFKKGSIPRGLRRQK